MTDKQMRPPYEIVLMHDHILRLEEELKAKEQECEELKIQNKRLNELTLYWHKRFFEVGRNELKLKQTLTEIKPILELYAISKVGEEQLDGTYKIMLGDSYIMAYDPNPAKEALQKISEVEDVSSNSQ